eukprot:675551-Prorocentrum_lima.AAC.1
MGGSSMELNKSCQRLNHGSRYAPPLLGLHATLGEVFVQGRLTKILLDAVVFRDDIQHLTAAEQ